MRQHRLAGDNHTVEEIPVARKWLRPRRELMTPGHHASVAPPDMHLSGPSKLRRRSFDIAQDRQRRRRTIRGRDGHEAAREQ